MIELLPHIYTLSNGLRLVYLHANSPVAHLGVTVLAGSRFEEDHEVGLAHFLEHSIFKGTEKRKAFHILKSHLNRAAELLSDIAINSNFPEKEIQKEKEIVLDELNSYLDNPSDKIFDDYEALIFPNHPLGNNILGTPESVQSFGRESLKSYVDKFFFTENTVLSFVGDIPLNTLVKYLEKHFNSMPSGKTKAIPRPFDTYQPIKKRVEEGNYQAHAIIGGIAPGYNSDHRRGNRKGRNLRIGQQTFSEVRQ